MKHSTNHSITHSPRLFQEKAAHFGTGTSELIQGGEITNFRII